MHFEDKDSIDRCTNESFSRAVLITLTPTFPTVSLAEWLHTSSFHTHSSHILRSPLCRRECTGLSLSPQGQPLPSPPSLPPWLFHLSSHSLLCNLKIDIYFLMLPICQRDMRGLEFAAVSVTPPNQIVSMRKQLHARHVYHSFWPTS